MPRFFHMLGALTAVVLLSACAAKNDAQFDATADEIERDAEILNVTGNSLKGEKSRMEASTEETDKALEALYEGKGFDW